MFDSRASWARLGLLLLTSSLGAVGMWSVVVTLPAVQAEFGAARAGASLPYTLTMLGFAAGGILMGRMADRVGIARALAVSAVALAAGYGLASQAPNLIVYALLHGVLVGMIGCGSLFGPIMVDASLWFRRRRGLAVTIAASGNYVAGAIWPPIIEAVTQAYGWRTAELGIAAILLVLMPPLAWALRAPAPEQPGAAEGGLAVPTSQSRLGIAPGALLALLAIAGVGCCVAMAMPQVHIVAYCGDLGYGPAHGAQMLSLMLGLGIVSRVGSGWVADRIGGLPTLLAGSVAQFLTLSLFLFFNSLTSLYVISALFGLFQGGIVPSYAIILREYFPARGVGAKVGTVLAATIVGMALGGWMTGKIFDLSGSYSLAFANGIGWNLLNLAIAATLLWRARMRLGGGTGRAHAALA
jgi:MFS family permease